MSQAWTFPGPGPHCPPPPVPNPMLRAGQLAPQSLGHLLSVLVFNAMYLSCLSYGILAMKDSENLPYFLPSLIIVFIFYCLYNFKYYT